VCVTFLGRICRSSPCRVGSNRKGTLVWFADSSRRQTGRGFTSVGSFSGTHDRATTPLTPAKPRPRKLTPGLAARTHVQDAKPRAGLHEPWLAAANSTGPTEGGSELHRLVSAGVASSRSGHPFAHSGRDLTKQELPAREASGLPFVRGNVIPQS